MTRLISLALCSVLLGSIPALGHHALTAYNRSQSKTVEGVVKEFRFSNPHARIILVVTAADGTTKDWDFEGGGIRRLQGRGVAANTIAKGDRITVAYNPMRDGSVGGFFVGFTAKDGKTYGTQR